MTANKLKIIACLSMLIDHVGVVLFPQVIVFRYIGRLAMPIFAFFIAEGCAHTRSKLKYFIKIFVLAVICQAIFLAEQLYYGYVYDYRLNILFTFSLSIIICSLFVLAKESFIKAKIKNAILYSIAFIVSCVFSVLACTYSTKITGVNLTFDYDIAGIFLPLFAVIFKNRFLKLGCFTIGLILFNLLLSQNFSYTWFSLLALPLIAFYNGKYGTKKLKYLFYLFYPVHFGLIYLIQILFF